jgi:hypothetical protein
MDSIVDDQCRSFSSMTISPSSMRGRSLNDRVETESRSLADLHNRKASIEGPHDLPFTVRARLARRQAGRTFLTLGFSYKVASLDGAEAALGVSRTWNALPDDVQADYAGNPIATKVFLQVGGMSMFGM